MFRFAARGAGLKQSKTLTALGELSLSLSRKSEIVFIENFC